MRTLLFTLLIFTYANGFSQQTVFNGKVIDATTKKPITGVAILLRNNHSITLTDTLGDFAININHTDSIMLNVFAEWYENKNLTIPFSASPLILELEPDTNYTTSLANISGIPTDSTFYSNGKIKSITYFDSRVVTYYTNGKIKSKSILKTSHSERRTEWYENGQIKSHGTLNWIKSENENPGHWIKDSKWKDWDEEGNLINKQEK